MGRDPEKEEKFIARCMGTELMKKEYPKNVQRLAICYSSWREAKGIKKEDTMEGKMDSLRSKVSRILEQAVSKKSWAGVNKSKLPASCFLWVEDPKKKATWHLPYKEGAGGINPKTGMYRSAGLININAVRQIMAVLGGARVKPGFKKFKAPASVVAKAKALAKRLKIGEYKENMYMFAGLPIMERFSSLRTAIETAIKAEFGKDHWISDFSNKEIIFRKEGDELSSTGEESYQKVGYKVTKGAVELVGAPEAVARIVNYEMSTKDEAALVVMESKVKSKL